MKGLIILFTVGFAFAACSQKSPDGAQLLKILNDENLSLVVSNGDSISRHAGQRVDDLKRLVTTEPERLRGAVVADKKVGYAAASLIACSGFAKCTPTMSPAQPRRFLSRLALNWCQSAKAISFSTATAQADARWIPRSTALPPQSRVSRF